MSFGASSPKHGSERSLAQGNNLVGETSVEREAPNLALMFNRLDFAAAEEVLDKMDQGMSMRIAAGERGLAFKLPEFVKELDRMRRQLRMMVLKTGQLSSDIRSAQLRGNKKHLNTLFRWRIPDHKKRSEEWRLLLGLPMQTKFLTAEQVADKAAEPILDTSINDLESRYYEDRRQDKWPFESGAKDFGVGYRGWLQWKFENGLVSLEVYRAEKERLG